MLDVSDPPADGSSMQQLINQKPTSSMFTECLLPIISRCIGNLFKHSLTVKEKGEIFAD